MAVLILGKNKSQEDGNGNETHGRTETELIRHVVSGYNLPDGIISHARGLLATG